MAGLAERGAGTFFGWLGARKSERQAKAAREEKMALIDRMDWQPMYASENAPTYQKTKSPVARAYLESLLLGQNPDATWEGATNAGAIKAAQQRTTDNLYGTVGERAAESAEVQKETPWAVTPPYQRQVGQLRPESGPMEGGLTALPSFQLDKELRARGVNPADVERVNRELVHKFGSIETALRMLQSGKGGY